MSALLATSFSEPGKVSFYNVVLFIHITAVIVAFGVTFAYPVLLPTMQRLSPQSMGPLHRVQETIGKYMITGGATVALLAGIYLAAKGPYDFSDAFVAIGLVGLLVLLGLGGAFFAPREKKLAELAERDAPTGQLSDEYQKLAAQVGGVGAASSLLVLVIVFLMVTKLGA
jgi:hypothetical protein